MREIAEVVRLPPHLADHPYLVEYYGTVEWSVKAVYHGYMGWFRWAKVTKDMTNKKLTMMMTPVAPAGGLVSCTPWPWGRRRGGGWPWGEGRPGCWRPPPRPWTRWL